MEFVNDCFNHAGTLLRQRVPTITDSDSEERFPGYFWHNLLRSVVKLEQVEGFLPVLSSVV